MVVSQAITLLNRFIQLQKENLLRRRTHIQIAKSARIITPESIFCETGTIKVGENTLINGQCSIAAGHGTITIGNDVLIGSATVINTMSHTFDRTDMPIRKQEVTEEPIIIEDDTWIGTHCTILGGTRIGAHSVIGAHSLVKGNIPPYSVAYGVPAKVKRTRQPTK
jgi:acetyltransferase-like isoleucine patch superfamily enzyme